MGDDNKKWWATPMEGSTIRVNTEGAFQGWDSGNFGRWTGGPNLQNLPPPVPTTIAARYRQTDHQFQRRRSSRCP